MSRWKRQGGFTLIEMIGVLAVIGVIMALVLPKVFDIISDSKANALAASIKTYETAVVQYYSDIGSLLPLNAAGTPTAETTGDSATATSLPARLALDASSALNVGTGQWPRFHGPYLERFVSTSPPALGTTMFMPATNPVAYGTAVTATNIGWDFNDDGNSDLASNSNVVYLSYTGISTTEWDKIDSILDAGIGTTTTERQLRGRVKYDSATDTLLVYLTHG